MGDLAEQTEVTLVSKGDDGSTRFRAMVHPDWEIWGPQGGYVAALALRAAGAASPFARPASFSCQYLSVAEFAPVDLVVTTRRSGRTVCAQRVEMTQGQRPILDAMVWSVGNVEGLVHHDVRPPDVPGPGDLASAEELWPEREVPFAYWSNFEQRPIDFFAQWPPLGPVRPEWRTWIRARPRATFEDPWLDAARTLVVIDVVSWPAGSRPHAYLEPPFIAPSLDLCVSFHQSASDEEWLLLDGHSPVAADGLLAWNGRIWNRRFELVASGGGQAVFRHT